ncbi:MAG TPA: TetR/AcrR family transcriptional regulator [Gemmatimonadaceae bacterium]|nr:TetR/AcrR family transcriptional regulator [Gemmatimonadaceae bacterium]
MAQSTPKWRRNPAERPRQILTAALEVFGEAGVARSTLDEIAERAGVSKGTIYLYFPNKEELFRQTIRAALTPTDRPAETPARASATRQLLDTVERQWQFLTSPDGVVISRLVSAEQWQFPELSELYGEEVVSKFAQELAPIIRRGTATGEFRELEPAHAARMLTALVVHSAMWRETTASPSASRKPGDAVLRELTDFYLQAIAPTEGAFPQADGAPNH